MNKLKELSKKKGFLTVVIILTIALVGVLGTYAMFYWRSADNTEITLKIGDVADVKFPNGQELNTNNLTPVFNYTDGETLTFSIINKVNTGENIEFKVNFNITNIDNELKNTSLKYKLLQDSTVVGEGNFSNASSNSTMKLANGNLPTGTSNYTLYLYIDGNIENDVNMMNKNINGIVEVTAEELIPFNLAQHITKLYTDADKTEVTNNSITYNYATSVSLMNDRLGGTAESLDGGNIRYYGNIVYMDEDDGTSEGTIEQGNWVSISDGDVPFSNKSECLDFVSEEFNCSNYSNMGFSSEEECNSRLNEWLEQSGFNSPEEICDTTTKHYRSVNNYIDIGDKYEEDTVIGNWQLISGLNDFEDSESCLEWMNNNRSWYQLDNIFSNTDFKSIEEICSATTVIPKGTTILWRILGVFDGKVRIVRDKAIGGYSWDTTDESINNGEGINEWSEADLMKLLNPNYDNNLDNKCTYDEENDSSNCETDLVNNSLYWNSQSGNCYVGADNTSRNCNFTNKGLSNSAKNYIVDQTIYLGSGFNMNFYSNEAYISERSSNVIQNPSDGVTRTTSWTGKVGLMYPSDYLYAVDLNSCTRPSSYYKRDECKNNNWLYNKQKTSLITPSDTSSNESWDISDSGNISNLPTRNSISLYIRPVLTLSSETEIISGKGLKKDPYVVTGSSFKPGDYEYVYYLYDAT